MKEDDVLARANPVADVDVEQKRLGNQKQVVEESFPSWATSPEIATAAT